MNVEFTTCVSRTQSAQRRWTHSPCTVCLNAPPSFGHSRHSCPARQPSRAGTSGGGTYDGVLGRHRALAAQPLALGDVRHAVAVCSSVSGRAVCGETEKAGARTLVHGEVAAVAEDDRVHVLALGVVADRAR
jgi:hypothetical protein